MKKDRPVFLLTTTDNPYNPFTDWISWYIQDLRLGYDTCGLIARLSSSSYEIDSEPEMSAMRSIVELNFSGKHVMVTEKDFETMVAPFD